MNTKFHNQAIFSKELFSETVDGDIQVFGSLDKIACLFGKGLLQKDTPRCHGMVIGWKPIRFLDI